MRLVALLPHLRGLAIDRMTTEEDRIVVEAHVAGGGAACPDCGGHAGRVHSRYWRTIADLPLAERPVVLRLRVRRFRCPRSDCPRVTFAEQVPAVAARYARRSAPLRAALEVVGLALGGRPGGRLARQLRLPTSRATLLRLVRAMPEPPATAPRVLGVDDFALARGHTYGTVLVDLEARRPVDVLRGRTADDFAAWLVAHPGAEVICRDRGGSYAEGARQGAPAAVQVADRFHLIQNLGEVLERLVLRLQSELRPGPVAPPTAEVGDGRAETSVPATAGAAPAATRGGLGAANRRARHAAVQELVPRGMSLSAIARALRLDRKTVRRYARAEVAPEPTAGPRRRRSILDPYLAHLDHRWREGCRNALALHHEIVAQGYRGSYTTVRACLAPWRECPLPRAARPPAVRTVVALLVRRPETLDERDQQQLAGLLARSGTLAGAYRLTRAFAALLHERRGADLDAWIDEAEASGIAEVRAFAAGLCRDREAVVAGLTLDWSSGPVEGQVTRIKRSKRQMFGRANFDLLRRRVLLAS